MKRVSKNIDYQKFGFLPYQCAWLEDNSKVKIFEKSRRIGITYAQAFEDVMDSGVYGLYDTWFSSNNDLNAREYIRYCKSYAQTLSLVVKDITGNTLVENAKTYSIEFKNGRRITAVSSSPEQLHGKGGKMVLDEFARREDEAETWEAASPAALIWDFPIRIISTHKGKNSMFYAFLQKVKKGVVKWSHHRTTFIEAVEQGLADKVKGRKLTKAERQEYVANIHQEVADNDVWNQQFMCEACDESETFLPYALLEANASNELLPFSELKNCKTLFAGLDIGRFKNLSLLWIIEQVSTTHFVTRHIRAIAGTDFPKQEKIINPFASLPNMRRICIDQTGMGIGLTDYLQHSHGKSKIEGVTFTSSAKETMAFRVKKWLEDKGLNIPDDKEIHDDFNSVKKEITSSGNIRLKADTNQKQTRMPTGFGAVPLACEAANSKPYTKPKVTTQKVALKGRLQKLFKRVGTMIKVTIDNLDQVLKSLKEKQRAIDKATENRQFKNSTGQLLVSRGKLNIDNSTAGDIPYAVLKPSTLKQKARLGYNSKPLERTGLLKSSLAFDSDAGLYITSVNYLKYHQSDEPRKSNLPQRKVIAITGDDSNLIAKYLIRAIQ